MTFPPVRRLAIRAGTLMIALALGGVSAVPAIADEAQPDLRLTAVFDKPAYGSTDPIGVIVSIVNAGRVPATVHAVSSGNVIFPPWQWRDLAPDRPGVRMVPGQYEAVLLRGQLSGAADQASLEFSAAAAEGDANPSDNRVDISAPIADSVSRGSYSGTVFEDADGDGVADPGEGLNLVQVSLTNPAFPPDVHDTTTNTEGRFAFQDIPIGRYRVSVVEPPGYRISSLGEILIKENIDLEVEIQAFRVPHTITGTLTFTKPSYTAGETASMTVTLTNTGSSALTGITAFCSGIGDGNEIGGEAGWGDLAYNGPGATLLPGETRTFDVSSVIPEAGAVFGFVVASCSYGDRGTSGSVTAKVRGLVGTVRGVLAYDRNSDGRFDGDGVADTKIVLVDQRTGEVVARTVTDANGLYEFADVPAGRYEFRPLGPWKVAGLDGYFQVYGGRVHVRRGDLVVPGAVQPDPDAPPSEEAPAPQGDVLPAAETAQTGTTTLAATGASVTGALVGGVVAVLIGFGLVLAGRRPSRRRRTAGW